MTKTLLITLCIALSGCISPPQLTLEQRQQLESATCVGAPACTVMWQRAQLWVIQNSGWKIQISNDVVIQTYGPGDMPRVAYTITKEPIKTDEYRIVMRASCGNIFGCIPGPLDQVIAFNNYLRQ